MNKSENINELATALAKAQGMMRGALKDSANPFFKSKYADLQSVTEAIREAFSSNGLSYIQHLSCNKDNEVGCETIIMHSSGQWIGGGVLTVPVSKHDAQGYGSAITYCRRYSLSAASGVAPEEDDGNAASSGKPSAKTPVKAALQGVQVTPENEAYLKELAGEIVQCEQDSGIAVAYDLMTNAKLDADDKLYLWNLLQPNSKLRAALKAEGVKRQAVAPLTDAEKVAAKTVELAEHETRVAAESGAGNAYTEGMK